MSTDLEEYSEVIRGREVSIEYNPQAHSARIEVEGLNPEGKDIEQRLDEFGIYTRVSELLSYGDDWVEVRLKPAASLELRDENGTLKKRPVTNPSEESVITKQRDSYRYSATCPIGLLKEMGIGEKAKLATYVSVEDGNLVITCKESDSPHSMVARATKGGIVHLPSAVCTAANLDGHSIDWELDEDTNALVGRTSLRLPTIDTAEEETGQHVLASIARKQQEVESDGESWTQEHFQTYIRSEHAEELDWEDGEYVDISLAQDEGTLVLVLDSDIRPGLDSSAPCVKKLNAFAKSKGEASGTQLNIYLPNALVYAMRLDEGPVRWALINSHRLAGWKPTQTA